MYHGKGVSKAIANVNEKLAPLFVGKDLNIADQKAMDQMMLDLDGTPAKSNLGIASRYITEVILKMCAVTLDLPISILTFIHYVSKTLLNRRQLNPGYFNGHLKGSRRPPRHSTLPVGYFPAQFSHHLLFSHLANLAGNKTEEMLMPIPVFNVINGGSHAGNKLAMQEFMLFPFGAETFSQAMKMGSETYHHLKVRCHFQIMRLIFH